MTLYCPYVTCKFNNSSIIGDNGECLCHSILLTTVEVEERDTQYLDCPRYEYDDNKDVTYNK